MRAKKLPISQGLALVQVFIPSRSTAGVTLCPKFGEEKTTPSLPKIYAHDGAVPTGECCQCNIASVRHLTLDAQ